MAQIQTHIFKKNITTLAEAKKIEKHFELNSNSESEPSSTSRIAKKLFKTKDFNAEFLGKSEAMESAQTISNVKSK